MPKILTGLDKFYYALMNYDTTAGMSYQTPVALKGAITVGIAENSEISILDADDGPYDSEESSGPTELDIGIADMSQEDEAAIMGHTITGGVMSEAEADRPVDIAFGFRAKRSNGGYSYYWFLKGKLAKADMNHETKSSPIKWQTPVFKAKFLPRVYDARRKYRARDDATDYTAAIGTAWFSSVYGTTADTTAPTFLSSVPSASMTSAAQTTNLTITFSEAILSSTVTAANFSIICATGSQTIPIATFAVSSATVTLTQASLMTASTTYNVVIGMGVKDEAGNGLSATHTYKFTTSA
jgi:phi13 family phage major tail protein